MFKRPTETTPSSNARPMLGCSGSGWVPSTRPSLLPSRHSPASLCARFVCSPFPAKPCFGARLSFAFSSLRGVSSCFLGARACSTCAHVPRACCTCVHLACASTNASSRPCALVGMGHVYGCVLTSGAGQLRDQGQMSVAGEVVQADEVYIARKFVGSQDSLEAVAVEDMDGALLLMDMEVDEEALMLSAARDLVNRVQKLKKKAGVSPSDSLVLAYQVVLLIRATSSQVACCHASLPASLSPLPALAISVDGGGSSLWHLAKCA